MEQKRENWGSRFGFIMATAGFAIGLGAVWRFPYMVGVNGGGAFLLVYIIISAVIGIPLFIAEMGLGRKTQLNPIDGMRKLTKKGSIWVAIGWLGVAAATIIMSYYVMLIGWMLAYFVKMITGQFTGATATEISSIYTAFTSNPGQVVVYTLIMIVILGVIVNKGLKNGIESCCKYLMPALLVLLIILAIRSLMLPGAMEGVKWYLKPNFSKINGKVILAALGQSFFAIGIGFAGSFVYGSYLDKKNSNLPGDATIIVVVNTIIAVVAGLVIFPAIFSFGMSPTEGPGLTFITMPNLFSKMAGGRIFGGAFFFLVIIAGITSGIGFLEAITCTVSEVFKIDRKKTVWRVLAVIFVLSIPCILSQGPWSNVEIIGKNLFDLADYISGSVLMPLGALLISLYIAKEWKFKGYMDECNVGGGKFQIKRWWKPIVILLIPISVCTIMITGLIQ
ncbi:sodium-dependent transporter [Clostridium ihumii]|uniref:sodium-dependent transporter n=1 Tax=Clostridium ihumii TaxID=1470356 RepID=UPI003D342BC4